MTTDDLRYLVGAECVRLAKLGSADAIAAEFSARGMTGKVGDCTQCPLARAISDTLMVMPGLISVTKHGINSISQSPDRLVAFQEGLAALRHFVDHFDHGHYPQLETA